MAQKVLFKRKTSQQIDELPIEDGSLIYNVENGKTYMDYGNNRIQTGGNAETMIAITDNEPTDEDIKLWIPTSVSNTKASEVVDSLDGNQTGYAPSVRVVNDVLKGIVLYDNVDGTTDTITLSDSVANYNYVEVFYKATGHSTYQSVKIYSPNGKTASLTTGLQSSGFIRVDANRLTLNDTTATFYDGGYAIISAGGTEFHQSDTIAVCRIVGYK